MIQGEHNLQVPLGPDGYAVRPGSLETAPNIGWGSDPSTYGPDRPPAPELCALPVHHQVPENRLCLQARASRNGVAGRVDSCVRDSGHHRAQPTGDNPEPINRSSR